MAIAYEKTAPETDPGTPEDAPETPQWTVILDAPDYRNIIQPHSTAKAKEYETKVLSVLKEVLRYRLTPEGLPDAAAILAHGPGFAQRAGQLADHDPNVARVLDMLTAPDSPWVLFAVTALPFVSQIFRNHEEQVKAVPARMKQTRAERKAAKAAGQPKPAIYAKIPFTSRQIKIPFRVHIPMGVFRSSTMEPTILTNRVFADPKVRAGLEKSYGIKFGGNGSAPGA